MIIHFIIKLRVILKLATKQKDISISFGIWMIYSGFVVKLEPGFNASLKNNLGKVN